MEDWTKSKPALSEQANECRLIRTRYFRPKVEPQQSEERAWTDVERDLLIQGIQQYGIGNWNDIRKELLNEWVHTWPHPHNDKQWD